MRGDSEMKGVSLVTPIKMIFILSNKENRWDNKDDQLLMFADNISTMITSVEQIKSAKQNFLHMKNLHAQNFMKERW